MPESRVLCPQAMWVEDSFSVVRGHPVPPQT